MVTTFLFATTEMGVMHERTACPSTCTVHAPQSAMPQPNLLPVSPSSSRSAHSSGVSPGTSTFWRLPLMSSETITPSFRRRSPHGQDARPPRSATRRHQDIRNGTMKPQSGRACRKKVCRTRDSLAAGTMNELFYLVSSFWLGALHAATPGHGKTIAAAYIVGARGRPVDALVLGIFVTLSHTSGIVLVAVLATLGSAWLLPQRVEAYVAVGTGRLVGAIGLLMPRVQMSLASDGSDAHAHDAEPEHEHEHAHEGHTHAHAHGHDHVHSHGWGVRHRHRVDP